MFWLGFKIYIPVAAKGTSERLYGTVLFKNFVLILHNTGLYPKTYGPAKGGYSVICDLEQNSRSFFFPLLGLMQ